MTKIDTYTAKWKSERFPSLILYEEEYKEMREIFRYIKSFRDEMLNLEKWIFANPERAPKTQRGWVKQVRNWMRLADRFAEEKYLRALQSGKMKDAKMSSAEAGARLSQILKRQQAVQAQEAKVRGEKSQVKKEADPQSVEDALSLIFQEKKS